MATVRKIRPAQGVLGAVTAAIDLSPWLGPSDQGTVALALDLARRLDASQDDRGAGYLAQLLAPVLRSLGGAPADRKALGVEEQVRGKLAALRASR